MAIIIPLAMTGGMSWHSILCVKVLNFKLYTKLSRL